MKLLGSYINGNYKVEIYDDGTKIKETINPNDNIFLANFPESMDVKITNCCDQQCSYCHEDSTPNGRHGDILNVKFIETLRPYVEMAIGGGDPLSHPQLIEFLEVLKTKNIIANITVSQHHFMKDIEMVNHLIDNKLIYGLGVSFQNYSDEFIEQVSQFPNAVLHIINGVIEIADLKKMYDKNLKVLILGYKQFRRGNEYYSASVEKRKDELYDMLPKMLKYFKVVSFDNLAIRQLDVQSFLSENEWNEFYMGDDGSHTMYVDLVNQKFAVNSTSKDTFDLLDSVDKMFEIVKNETK